MPRYFLTALLLLLACLVGCAERGSTQARSPDHPQPNRSPAPAVSSTSHAGQPKSRTFQFTYAATITGLEPGSQARVWLPMATDSSEQRIRNVKIDVPGDYQQTRDRAHKNPLIYFQATADTQGNIPIHVDYTVHRHEVRQGQGDKIESPQMARYLAATKMVPVDGSMLAKVFGKKAPKADNSMVLAKQVYDAVGARMQYKKPVGKPWGRGDAKWACDSRFGNCTDFHSLFISVARDLNIPSKFEIGFPIPADKPAGEVPGYHCWAKFVHDDRWVAVDISEANKHPRMKQYYYGNLTPDRVTFSVGRDLQLDPPQNGPPVNFLVYPYVEVGGKSHTKLIKRFRYSNL